MLTPPDLDRAVAQATEALSKGADLDWSVDAHQLDWSCRVTGEHVADCHVGYALLVTGRRTERYLPVELALDEDADATGIVESLGGTGGLLSSVLTMAPADVVVWHPYGKADLEAVAGMGIIETLVHAWDIAVALGLPFTPDPDLCAVTLARMFPEVPAGNDPWQSLLWATGRIDLDDRPRRTSWRWTNDLSRSRP
jgi:uncharacterized protein (TIGR03083 family)